MEPGAVAVDTSASRAEDRTSRKARQASNSDSGSDRAVRGNDAKAVLRNQMSALRRDIAVPGAVAVADTDGDSAEPIRRATPASRKNQRMADSQPGSTKPNMEKQPPLNNSELNEELSVASKNITSEEQPLMPPSRPMVSLAPPRTKQDEEETENDEKENEQDEEEGIVSAKVIDEDELKAEYQKEMMGNIAVAAVVDEEENKDSRRYPYRACLLVLVLAIVLSIVLPLTIGGDTPIPPEVTSSPSPAPTFLTDYEFLQKVLGPISGDEVWMDETSPQSQALNWLAFEDPAMLPIKDTKASSLIERYALAVLYFSTGGPQWAGSVKFLSNYSVCDWKDDRNAVHCYDIEPKVKYIFIGELSLSLRVYVCVCPLL
jgi:hypothetical protein